MTGDARRFTFLLLLQKVKFRFNALQVNDPAEEVFGIRNKGEHRDAILMPGV